MGVLRAGRALACGFGTAPLRPRVRLPCEVTGMLVGLVLLPYALQRIADITCAGARCAVEGHQRLAAGLRTGAR